MESRFGHGLVTALAMILAGGSGDAASEAKPESPPVKPVPQLKPGLWEILVRINVPDGPVQDASQVIRHCYSQEDLADPRSAIPRAGPDCEIHDFRLDGARATWSLRCSGPSAVSGGGEMMLGREAYVADVWNKITDRGRTLDITQRIRARRLGDCVPGDSGTEKDSP